MKIAIIGCLIISTVAAVLLGVLTVEDNIRRYEEDDWR